MKRLVLLFFVVSMLTTSVEKVNAKPEVFKITAYCSCEKCCDKDPSDEEYGVTASGKKAHWGTVAVDRNVIGFGRRFRIEGFSNITFRAEDIGSAIKGKHIDVWFPSHPEALKFGVQYRKLTWTM